VRVLLCKICDGLGECELEHESTLYNVSCVFYGPVEWCHELWVREREENKVKHSHGGADLDVVKGAGTTD
jgi:hypothetical protein